MTTGTLVVGGRSRVHRRTGPNYDLELWREVVGGRPRYETRVRMKLQFLFVEGTAGKLGDTQQRLFVHEWKRVVQRHWTRPSQRPAGGIGYPMALAFAFETRIGGIWLTDHWEIEVLCNEEPWWPAPEDPEKRVYGQVWERWRYGPGPQRLSRTGRLAWRNRVLLTQHANQVQQVVDGIDTIVSVHEFGHMLGGDTRADEYPPSSPHSADSTSVMHYGLGQRVRHVERLTDWGQAWAAAHEADLARRREAERMLPRRRRR